MFTFLLIVHALIAATLVGVILMQRSEGGGLGMGSGPSGLMTARGAADFLTRATTVLATLFVLMSLGLAVLATQHNAPGRIDTSLARKAPLDQALPAAPADPLAAAAAGGATQDVVNAGQSTSRPDPAPVPGPGSATANSSVPLAR